MGIITQGAEEHDLEMYTNADFELVFIMHEDAAKTILTDTTGYSGKLQIKPQNSNNVLLELSDVNGRIVFGGVDGSVRLTVDNATLTAIPELNNAEYDLLITNLVPVTKKYIYGKVVLDKGITQL